MTKMGEWDGGELEERLNREGIYVYLGGSMVKNPTQFRSHKRCRFKFNP